MNCLRKETKTDPASLPLKKRRVIIEDYDDIQLNDDTMKKSFSLLIDADKITMGYDFANMKHGKEKNKPGFDINSPLSYTISMENKIINEKGSSLNEKRSEHKFDTMWEKRYNELKLFLRQHGHCHVPQRYAPNKALGKWVHKHKHEL